MKELSRQFVLFGNFNSVTFDSILKLSDLREKYNLKVNAMPDIPPLSNPQQPLNVQFGVPESRPIFQTLDKRTTIFFGTNRIHIEQLDSLSETYQIFNGMVMDIVSNVVENLGINVTRVALNGRLYNADKEWSVKVFNSIFNKSKLYSDKSNEWTVRICDKESNSVLGCEINKIAQYTRGKFVDISKQELDGLIASYDFNTQINVDKIFNETEIQEFNKLAQEYRASFL